MDKEALTGLKALEYGEFISGPYCGKLLADLGAEVIKVEQPGLGDKARQWGPFPQDLPHPEKSGLFLYLNTNKLGVTLNLSSNAGVKIFKELLKQVDVVIENNPPKEMKRLGLDYESLCRINPRLVVTSITPFGQTGPYRDYKGCDLIGFHMSGEAYINPLGGVDDIEQQPPLKVPGHTGDFMAGLSAAVCTMSAVIAQQATDLGQHVDLSQHEALVHMTVHEIGAFTYEGIPYKRKKDESPSGRTGFGVQPSKDGHLVMSISNDNAWAGLVEMIGNPDWAKSEQYKDPASRRNKMNEIAPKVTEWLKDRTTKELIEAVQGKRIPFAPLNTVKEAINSEQLAVRDFFVDVDHREAGKFKYPGAPYKLSGTPWRVKRPAPLLGEHNEEVYCQMLGYSRQDLVKMRQAGVI